MRSNKLASKEQQQQPCENNLLIRRRKSDPKFDVTIRKFSVGATLCLVLLSWTVAVSSTAASTVGIDSKNLGRHLKRHSKLDVKRQKVKNTAGNLSPGIQNVTVDDKDDTIVGKGMASRVPIEDVDIFIFGGKSGGGEKHEEDAVYLAAGKAGKGAKPTLIPTAHLTQDPTSSHTNEPMMTTFHPTTNADTSKASKAKSSKAGKAKSSKAGKGAKSSKAGGIVPTLSPTKDPTTYSPTFLPTEVPTPDDVSIAPTSWPLGATFYDSFEKDTFPKEPWWSVTSSAGDSHGNIPPRRRLDEQEEVEESLYWELTTDEAATGVYAIKTPDLMNDIDFGNDVTTPRIANVTLDTNYVQARMKYGHLSFSILSDMKNEDVVSWYVDGVLAGNTRNTRGKWRSYDFELRAGSKVTWEYWYYPMYAEGGGVAFVDDVFFIPRAIDEPSSSPTTKPTDSPIFTMDPTASPTSDPDLTHIPTTSPRKDPTSTPTFYPTVDPTSSPTMTRDPTLSPTRSPTVEPTSSPTMTPNLTLSPAASIGPTTSPSSNPTYYPTFYPTGNPTYFPTFYPTKYPTSTPTMSRDPSSSPTRFLMTAGPTMNPVVTQSPTKQPTDAEGDTWSQMGDVIDGIQKYDEAGRAVAVSSDGMTLAVGVPGYSNNTGQVRVYKRTENGTWSQQGESIDGTNTDIEMSVDISSNGTIMALGWPKAGNVLEESGVVRVYMWDDNASAWLQMGQDLEGETAKEQFGLSISLSDQQMSLAVGSPFRGDKTGQVIVYRYFENGDNWAPVGDTIRPETSGGLFGRSVALSKSGETLAVGAPFFGNYSGQVQIYKLFNAAWSNYGGPFNGKDGEWFGISVNLDENARVLAIGASFNNENGFNAGRVAVYGKESIRSWAQIGNSIYGQGDGDYYGEAMSLSRDGTTVAVGDHRHDEFRGQVRVFKLSEFLDQLSWEQVGNIIDGEEGNDWSGFSVALSYDGETVAIGAPLNNGGGLYDSGQVRVYEFSAASEDPTTSPTHGPTADGDIIPTSSPTMSPTAGPTVNPVVTQSPTKQPTDAECPAKSTNCYPGGCDGVCSGATGSIGNASCEADYLDDGTCVDLQADIGEGSCFGKLACKDLQGRVGNGTCQFARSCLGSIGSIESGSCLGTSSCEMNNRDIGKESCLGKQSCYKSSGRIDNGSCVGRLSCLENSGEIGNFSCLQEISEDVDNGACEINAGIIGTESCKGLMACYNNTGTIGDNSCNGYMACVSNEDEIGNGECNGHLACDQDSDASTVLPT